MASWAITAVAIHAKMGVSESSCSRAHTKSQSGQMGGSLPQPQTCLGNTAQLPWAAFSLEHWHLTHVRGCILEQRPISGKSDPELQLQY